MAKLGFELWPFALHGAQNKNTIKITAKKNTTVKILSKAIYRFTALSTQW